MSLRCRGCAARKSRIAILAASALLLASAKDVTGSPTVSALYKDSRARWAQLRAEGRPQSTLLMAARSGSSATLAGYVKQLGGTVRQHNADVDYLRVDIASELVPQVLRSTLVEAVALDLDLPDASGANGLDDGESLPGAHPNEPVSAPVPAEYSPREDLDIAEFAAAYPTADGRGVTIAVLDEFPDLLLPELRNAAAIDGRPLPKIADVINATDPVTDARAMPEWVRLGAAIASTDGTAAVGDRQLQLPRAGTFRVGWFDARRFVRQQKGSNRDRLARLFGIADDTDGDGRMAVLVDETSGETWIDRDRDLSLADEPKMMDYGVSRDIGVLGSDDPLTHARDTLGFTVQLDRRSFVALNFGSSRHGTSIMTSVVAHRTPTSRYEGIAPGSQLIAVRFGQIAHAMVEALILAFEDPRVDIVVLEQNQRFAGKYVMRDGRHPITMIIQRLIERHRKPLFVPAGNAAGLTFAAEEGAAPGAFSIGGYQSARSYHANLGFRPARHDNLHAGGVSHGPGGDGALKPDLLAPTGHVAGMLGFLEGTARHFYRLPPGNEVGGGTSQAAPVAAGVAALLISAARQSGIKCDLECLRRALLSGARFCPDIPAHEQGAGVIRVGASWKLLKRLSADVAASPVLAVQAPVRTVTSHLLATPHTGRGLYEREGWRIGQSGHRTITLTRHTGGAEPLTYQVEWEGDPVFGSASTVTLPLGTPVDLSVRIASVSPGVNSARMSLRDRDGMLAGRVLATIVAANEVQPDLRNMAVGTDVPYPGDRSVFLAVPTGLANLRVSLSSPDSAALSSLRLVIHGPDGEREPASWPQPADSKRAFVIPAPAAGTWEFAIWNAGPQSAVAAGERPLLTSPMVPATITIIPIAAGADPAEIGDRGLEIGDRDAVGAAAVPYAIARELSQKPSQPKRIASWNDRIMPGEQLEHAIDIPPGAEWIWVRTFAPSRAGLDIDGYLIDCTTPQPQLRAKQDSPAADGWFGFRNPQAGAWKLVVDAFSSPADGADVRTEAYIIRP